ncbi:MAG: prepilin-type N-terminal cleavage/methylation domain-containing protein [Acidimicrobiales bacterium]
MLEAIRRRREIDEAGFNLIEILVVVLIIAILLAIAIPTFLGARQRAQNRAAQSDIRNALAAEKVFYTDDELYTDTPADLDAIEPQLTYNTGTTPGGADREVWVELRDAIAVGDASAVCVSRQSASGTPFSLLDVAIGANAGTFYYAVSGCNAEDGLAAPTGPTTGW